jgi:hypothetical protein
MKTINLKLYKFHELSEESKQEAINNWKDTEDFSGLHETIEFALQEIFKERGIKIVSNFNLNYSLSCCQGDGVSFTGLFDWKGVVVRINRISHHYSHECTVKAELCNDDNKDQEKGGAKTPKLPSIEEIESERIKICKELEKIGYTEIDYLLSDEYVTENLEAQDFDFTEDGKIY